MHTTFTMKRQDFRFFHRLRVRWAEVDMQKIVFNAHYLMYFDTAIADYWRALALPYEESMHELGGDLYVKKATVEFHASARMDDQIDVGMKCERIGNSSILFTCAIFRGDELLITGELVYVFADPQTQTSRPVPQLLRATLTGYEAGESMVDVRWRRAGTAGPGRRACAARCSSRNRRSPWTWSGMMPMPRPCTWSLYNRLGQPVATGRLLAYAPGVATYRAHGGEPGVARHRPWSRILSQVLLDAAWERGDHEVMLNAQHSAAAFYARQGFERAGSRI